MSGLWRSRDPLLRWLRALSVVAFLTLVVVVVLRSGAVDIPLVALLSGAVLLQLGYEVIIPGLTRGAKSADQRDEEAAGPDERRG